MFEGLQKKWKVGAGRLVLILITFALGGSATGYVGKRLMSVLDIQNPWVYVPVYIIVVTIIWPMMVLIVSIPFGQFNFFRSYIAKLGRRMAGRKSTASEGNPSAKIDHAPSRPSGVIPEAPGAESRPRPVHIAIFASGAGSNARKLLEHFNPLAPAAGHRHQQTPAVIRLIVSNKPDAGVLNIAREYNVPVLILEKEKFFRANAYVNELKELGIDLIVLAGFLWKVPLSLIAAYPARIVNIHPALLPKYGGKGLYGHFVHEAVLNAGEKESGITIHYVDEHYDHGDHIFQDKVAVSPDDTPDTLARKVQRLEHAHFARVIDELIQKQNHR